MNSSSSSSKSFQSLDNRILCTELLEDAFGGADFKNNRAYQQMLFEEMSRVSTGMGMGSMGSQQMSLVEMNKRLMQLMTARIRCAISSSSSSSAVVPRADNIHDDDRDRPLENIDSLLEKKLLQRQEFGALSPPSVASATSVAIKKAFQIREDLNNVNIIDYDLDMDVSVVGSGVGASVSKSNEMKKKIRLEDIMDVAPIPDTPAVAPDGAENKKTLSEILNLMKSLQRDIGLIKQKLGLGNL